MIRTDIDWSAKPAPWCWIGPAYRAECEKIARSKIPLPPVPEPKPDSELRQWRKAGGLSQNELARRMGVSSSTVGSVETERTTMSLANWNKAREICRAAAAALNLAADD